MREEKESFIILFLKKIGLIKEYEIPKSEMCKNAQSICNHDCNACAWKEWEMKKIETPCKDCDRKIIGGLRNRSHQRTGG